MKTMKNIKLFGEFINEPLINEMQGFPVEKGKVPIFIAVFSDRGRDNSQFPDEYIFLPSYSSKIIDVWKEVIAKLDEMGMETGEDDIDDYVITAYELSTGKVHYK